MKSHDRDSATPLLEGEYIIEKLGSLRSNQACVVLARPQSKNILGRVRIACPHDEARPFGGHLYQRVKLTISLIDEPAIRNQGDEP